MFSCLRLAKVAELVDALALGASGETRESSSLSFRTSIPKVLSSREVCSRLAWRMEGCPRRVPMPASG